MIIFQRILSAQNTSVGIGVYDGKIQENKLVLVVETKAPDVIKGHFVLNRGKALEDVHSFLLILQANSLFLILICMLKLIEIGIFR